MKAIVTNRMYSGKPTEAMDVTNWIETCIDNIIGNYRQRASIHRTEFGTVGITDTGLADERINREILGRKEDGIGFISIDDIMHEVMPSGTYPNIGKIVTLSRYLFTHPRHHTTSFIHWNKWMNDLNIPGTSNFCIIYDITNKAIASKYVACNIFGISYSGTNNNPVICPRFLGDRKFLLMTACHDYDELGNPLTDKKFGYLDVSSHAPTHYSTIRVYLSKFIKFRLYHHNSGTKTTQFSYDMNEPEDYIYIEYDQLTGVQWRNALILPDIRYSTENKLYARVENIQGYDNGAIRRRNHIITFSNPVTNSYKIIPEDEGIVNPEENAESKIYIYSYRDAKKHPELFPNIDNMEEDRVYPI